MTPNSLLTLRKLAAPLLGLSLLGCQPDVDLSAIAAESAKPLHRFDQLQAVVATGPRLRAVGANGAYLGSDDAGLTWQRQVLPGEPPLIEAVTCPNGSVVSLDFWGKVWIEASGQQPTSHQHDLEGKGLALTCDPANRIWVAGEYGQVTHSEDGGDSWQMQDLGQGEDLILTTIDFLDDQRGAATGEFGTVFRTDDGGATWQRLPSLDPNLYPQDVLLVSPQEAFLASLSGLIYHTADGGQTWNREETGTTAALYRVLAVDGTFYAVGDLGTILRRDGDRWSPLHPQDPVFAYLRGGAIISGQRLVLAGGNGTLRTIKIPELREQPAAQQLGGRAETLDGQTMDLGDPQ